MNAFAALAALLSCSGCDRGHHDDAARLADHGDGRDWAGFGRTFGEQHYSPLTQVSDHNVARLGLAWWLDIPSGNTVSGPLAVDGILYVATGYSVIRAIDAATGRQLWLYDPQAAKAAGHKLRAGWGIRGLAWWKGRIYTGTHDGRLIAIEAKTGKPLWSVMTVDKDDVRFISGPPRVFDGKVIIGHGGADIGSIRGYVTTYDAETGKQLWRFYTVPGNPADGFESKAMEMAAATWAGEWWKQGGGGTVWNAMSYDPETDTVFIGVGNGSPWNRQIRSAGQGDNLFLCSIVALDAKSGAYKWHYQINPGESWDYNAAMDIELATLTIDGRPRKVVMQAPKNGFFYVIDRETGKLISAEPFAKVNWASKIDIVTGRPVEIPGIRYENAPVTLWPGPQGAHNWLPMSFNPGTGLVYIPKYDMPASYDASGITPQNWVRTPGNVGDYAARIDITVEGPGAGEGALIAWDPVLQKQVWQVPNPGFWNGGTMTTAGNLVFQGQADGSFNAYAADSGQRLWSFAAGTGVLAPPITYQAQGRQYVTVLSGFGASGALFGQRVAQFGWDARTQARRVLTFVLGGTAKLPAPPVHYRPSAPPDPDFVPDSVKIARGVVQFGQHCVVCHGVDAIAAGLAPDLRASPIPQSSGAFDAIVRDGQLVERGMPRFEELSDADREGIQQYVRNRARELAAGQ